MNSRECTRCFISLFAAELRSLKRRDLNYGFLCEVQSNLLIHSLYDNISDCTSFAIYETCQILLIILIEMDCCIILIHLLQKCFQL